MLSKIFSRMFVLTFMAISISCLFGCQTELEGTWKGKAHSSVQEDTRTYEMIFNGFSIVERRYTEDGLVENLLDGTFYLDKNANPKEITIEIQIKATGVVKGIYKIENETLYYAPSTSYTGSLPNEDQLNPEVSRFVLVLEKQNKVLDILKKTFRQRLMCLITN